MLHEGAEAVDLRGAEGRRLAEDGGAGARVTDLEPEGEVTGEEAKADGDAVGGQAGADQMIEVMAMKQLVDRLLDAPAAAVECDEPARSQPLDIGHVHPGAAGVRGRASRQ